MNKQYILRWTEMDGASQTFCGTKRYQSKSSAIAAERRMLTRRDVLSCHVEVRGTEGGKWISPS